MRSPWYIGFSVALASPAFAAPAASPTSAPRPEVNCPLPTAKEHPSNRDVTPKRCVQTSYSFAGCTDDYPREARECLHNSCEFGDTLSASSRNTVCTREAEMMIDGIGGPKRATEGLAQLEKSCRDELVIACVDMGLRVADSDAKRAMAYYHRACEVPAKDHRPGTCLDLRRKLKLPAEPKNDTGGTTAPKTK